MEPQVFHSDIKITKLRPFLRDFSSTPSPPPSLHPDVVASGTDTIGFPGPYIPLPRLANKENEKAEEATTPQE